MGHTNDRSTKASSLVNPTSLNLQPRPFAPLESDEKEEAILRKSGYSENFLEKIINTPSPESATPVQRKSGNRLKAIASERNNAALQNQSIQRQESIEEEKSDGEQENSQEFTMNPEPPPVQRKFENRLRAKAAQRMAIQAKLSIGEPNDKYEQEADATAARVVQQINSSIPSQSQPIQCQELEEDEELQMKPFVQRRENLGGGEASTDLESSIQSARGSGQSLDANLQQSMGQAMGADFSGVKVHTDSQSDQLNKSIQAKAFTTGQDVFFRQGAYEPSSRGGQELIAHELTHVVQQNAGAVQRQAEEPTARLGKLDIHTPQDISSENGAEDLIQRLKWTEVFTDDTKVVGLTDKQIPKGVEEVTGENETQDRKVFAGQTKKGRSGFLWHKDSTLEIQYDIKSMKQYKIIDPDTVFYTAVRESAVEPIKKHGIDPNFGNAEKPDGSTEYNVRGFNYFGKDKKIPSLYGSKFLDPEKWTILSFHLPEGTLIERDPEIPDGLRTTYHIKPSDIT